MEPVSGTELETNERLRPEGTARTAPERYPTDLPDGASGSGTLVAMGDVALVRAEPPRSPAEIRRMVVRLAWPVILENLLQTMIGVVDMLMVSRLGREAIAGVGVANQILFVVFAGVGALAMGTTVMVARFTGARQAQMASRALQQSIFLCVLLAAMLTTAGTAGSHWMVQVLGPEPEVVRLGGDYLHVVFLFSFFLVAMFVLGAALRGAGDSKTPMLVTALSNVINAAVAYALIFGVAGLPALGVIGSAWGAVCARVAGTVLLLLVLVRGRAGLYLPLRPAGWAVDLSLARRILAVGIPSMIEQLSRSGGMLVYSTVVISLGTMVFATQRITFNVLGVAFMPGFGFGMAATALTGQSLGARRPEQARLATWFAMRSCIIWMSLAALTFFFLGEQIMRLFTNDPEIVQLGALCLKIVAFGQPLQAISMVTAGGLRGAGDTRYPMLVTSASMWLVRIPVAYMLAVRAGLGLPGAFYSFLFGSLLEASLNFLRYRAGKWQRIEV
jgi:MATE family multidrug resistance protein